MGASWESHRDHMGAGGDNFEAPGGAPASAGPRNIRQPAAGSGQERASSGRPISNSIGNRNVRAKSGFPLPRTQATLRLTSERLIYG